MPLQSAREVDLVKCLISPSVLQTFKVFFNSNDLHTKRTEITSSDITNNIHLIHSPLTMSSLHHPNYIATHDKDLRAWILVIIL